MKKKFKFLLFIITLLNLIFYNSVSYSKDKCLQYFDTLESEFDKYRPELSPLFERDGFGFSLLAKWDEDKDDWVYYQDDDGYYYVGKIAEPELVNKIFRKQKIILAR